MGTVYTVKFIADTGLSLKVWEKKLSVLLRDVNQKLSMFDPKSELSRFNEAPVDQPVKVSSDFFSILSTAGQIHELTGGSWDGTVKPLVDLWGFGILKNSHHVPEHHQIAKALANTGFGHIQRIPPQTVQKNRAVTLDLGSIAKGYGVDKVLQLFQTNGIQDVLVEIGGELSAAGKNLQGEHWRVGINRPDTGYQHQNLFTVLRLENQAIATSGDYRNFFTENGKTYTHVIDPATGYPIETSIISVSVISDTCTFADGLATGLMVMDVNSALALVNQIDKTECLIITRKNNRLASHFSRNFNRAVVQ